MTTTRIIATGLAIALVFIGVGVCNMLMNFGAATRRFAELSAVRTNAVIVDLSGLTKKP